MSSLPLSIHTAEQMRAIDRYAIDHLQVSGYTLMQRAGEAALRVLRGCWPATHRIAVVCGPGNNGGDGYVLARLAAAQRLHGTVVALTDVAALRGDARRAYEDFVAAGGRVQSWDDACLLDAEVIVDAIFGIGLSRPLDSATAERIDAINTSGARILALDIPSGLHADSGEVLGAAVSAERTVSFLGLKLGFYLGEGPDYTGIVMFDDLDLPPDAFTGGQAALRIDENAVAQLLPRRRRTSHKRQQGHVVVIGGTIGMASAVRMVGEAALRAGAGLVTVVTREANVASITASRPELMCRGVESRDDLLPVLDRADILAIGPGLGMDEWAQVMLDAVIASGRPVVIDADGLNLLARKPQTNANWILTPHPGEAGRLLGIPSSQVQRERLDAARAIAARYGGIVVLKGAGTLVVDGTALPAICDQGNPGMASPGMGDVLTGVIAGVAAQTSDLAGAARTGVLVHAMAGDMAARRGERGLLATDLFAYLQTCVNPTQRI